MFNWIKKIFLPRFEGVRELKEPPDLSKAYKFFKADDKVEAHLHQMLKALETDNRPNNLSVKRKPRSFSNIRDIQKFMMQQLKKYQEHFADLFEGAPYRVTFYLARNVFNDGTVEIIVEVYDEKHDGTTYMNIVAKLSNGRYTCWAS